MVITALFLMRPFMELNPHFNLALAVTHRSTCACQCYHTISLDTETLYLSKHKTLILI